MVSGVISTAYQKNIESRKIQNNVTPIKILKYYNGFIDLYDFWWDYAMVLITEESRIEIRYNRPSTGVSGMMVY